MKIHEMTWKQGNDFRAILECEHCEGKQDLVNGYSDQNYYSEVLPKIVCVSCGKDAYGETSWQVQAKQLTAKNKQLEAKLKIAIGALGEIDEIAFSKGYVSIGDAGLAAIMKINEVKNDKA